MKRIILGNDILINFFLKYNSLEISIEVFIKFLIASSFLIDGFMSSDVEKIKSKVFNSNFKLYYILLILQ